MICTFCYHHGLSANLLARRRQAAFGGILEFAATISIEKPCEYLKYA